MLPFAATRHIFCALNTQKMRLWSRLGCKRVLY